MYASKKLQRNQNKLREKSEDNNGFKEANPVLLERKYSVLTLDIFHDYLKELIQ